MAAAFGDSPEAALVYNHSNGQADAAMVTTAYVHLFGRVPTDAEAQFWVGVGASLKLSPALLALTISGSAQGADAAAGANRLAYVQQWADSFNTLATNGKVSVADAMVLASQQLANIGAAPSSLTAALSATLVTLSPPPSAAPAPAPVQTVLTTGTDTITTSDGSPVFTATLGGGAPTLTANDSVHGNGNRLNITDGSTSSSKDMLPSGVSLAGIATVALTTSGNAGTDASHPFDLSGATGLTSFILNASGTHGDFVTLAAGAAASITTSSATVGVGTSGAGSTLTLADSALTTLNLAGNVSLASAMTLTKASSTVSGATDHAALTFTVQVAGTAGNSGVVAGASGSAGGTAGSATVTLGNGGDTLTLSSQGGFGGAGAVALNTVSGSAGGNGGIGGSAGSDSVTLGNGNNTITLQDTGAAGGVGGAGTPVSPVSRCWAAPEGGGAMAAT